MNRHELKALRNLFHLSVKEAAEHVGHARYLQIVEGLSSLGIGIQCRVGCIPLVIQTGCNRMIKSAYQLRHILYGM